MEASIADHIGDFFERLGEGIEELGEQLELAAARIRHEPAVRDDREIRLKKLDSLDRTRIYVADESAQAPTIKGISLPGLGRLTAAITVRAPDEAKPGDNLRFDVMQRQQGRIVGGSTYIVSVFDASNVSQPRLEQE